MIRINNKIIKNKNILLIIELINDIIHMIRINNKIIKNKNILLIIKLMT